MSTDFEFFRCPIIAICYSFQRQFVSLFRKMGGIEMNTPLLSYDLKTDRKDAYRLMTTSGHVGELRYDLLSPVIRHVELNGITTMRHYAVDHVYRATELSSLQPKTKYECAFAIVKPSDFKGRQRSNHHLLDAELILAAYQVMCVIPVFNEQVLSFRVNHSSMLRAIMLRHSVPQEKYSDILNAVQDYIDSRVQKSELNSIIRRLLGTSHEEAAPLINLFLTEFRLNLDAQAYNNIQSIQFPKLFKGCDLSSQLARSAMDEIQNIVSWANIWGVKVTQSIAFPTANFTCSDTILLF